VRADQLFNVTGQVALVTGAASGLGLAMSEVMAANGAHVAMLDVNGPGVEKAAATLRTAGYSVEPIEIDAGDIDRLRNCIDSIAASRGRLDAVFANAGISAGPNFRAAAGQIENISLERWEKVLHINLTSVFATVQAAATPMKRQRSGRVVVTASVAGLRADRMVGYGYAATKAAVINLVRQAAMELAPYNVLVNAIAPGPFWTNIGEGRLYREPEFVKTFEAMVPLGRMAQTDEIKGLALFLASPASSFVTGAVIPIDGGITAG
jgi:NAD(P)-dependent dehydrogenase (short-subunit alcohol dehydrogenase family)